MGPFFHQQDPESRYPNLQIKFRVSRGGYGFLPGIVEYSHDTIGSARRAAVVERLDMEEAFGGMGY